MIKIEIKTSEVQTRSGNKNGRDWQMRTQEAWAHTINRNGTSNPYPEKITITLDRDQQPYPVGTYSLQPSSLYVGDFGSLRLGTPVLAPISSSVRPAQAVA